MLNHIESILNSVLRLIEFEDPAEVQQIRYTLIFVTFVEQAGGNFHMQLPQGAISGCVNSKWIYFDGRVVRHLGDYYKFNFSELHLYQVLFLREFLLDRLLVHSICQEVLTLNASL